MKIINWNNNDISNFCLGTVQLGLNYGISNKTGQLTEEAAYNLLEYSISNGINCIDTARNYGTSEQVIGNFLKKNIEINPLIISKINSDLFYLNDKELIFEITKTKKILSKNLFGLLLHDSDALMNWSESNYKKIYSLKKSGLIKYFGVSIYNNEEFKFAVNCKDIDIIQIPFNIFDHRAIKNNWFKESKKNNKLLFIRSVFLQGLMFMNTGVIPAYLSSAEKYINIIEDLCKKINMSRLELAVSFVHSFSENSVILFGCDNINQLKKNIGIFNNINRLDKDIIKDILVNMSEVDEKIYNPTKWKRN